MISIMYLLLQQFFYAILFGMIEACFVYFTNHMFRTTFEQFIISFCLSPFMIQIMRMMSMNSYSIIIIAPTLSLTVWITEIVGHFTLLFYFGNNKAWTYTTNDALFCGAIRIYYFIPFFILTHFMIMIDKYMFPNYYE